MKKKNLLVALLALGVMGTATLPNVISADAGSSRAYVATEATIHNGSINEGDMIVSGKVGADGDYAVFNENSSRTAKLISKTKVNNMKKYGVKSLLEASYEFVIESIATDGKISVVVGLDGLSLGAGSVGSFEIAFSKNVAKGGVDVAVVEYLGENVPTEIVAKSYFSSIQLGTPFVLDMSISTDKKIALTVAEKKIVDGYKLGVDPTGYTGVISYSTTTEKNLFKVGKINAWGYSYDQPENVNYTETFDNDEYNANVFYSKSGASPVSPSSLSVEDGMLHFRNATQAQFITKYQYSNFELEFELHDLQREAEFDEQGNLVELISSWFAICYGVDDWRQTSNVTEAYDSWLLLEGMSWGADKTIPSEQSPNNPRYVPYLSGVPQNEGIKTMSEYNVWDTTKWTDDTVFNIKFVMQDGLMSLYIKTTEDADYGSPKYEYGVGLTDLGYVGLFTTMELTMHPNGLKYCSPVNFSIDNLSIKNLDYEGNVKKSPAFVSNKVEKTPDFVFENPLDDAQLLGNKLKNGGLEEKTDEGCGSSIASIGGFGIAAALALVLKRRK